LDSGEIRFCRYCGFALADTKDALHGYSERKRTGFSIVTWSYALLLVVTLLLQGQYVSLNTGWVYWLLTLLIVLSVSFFASAAVSALKPSLFAKGKRDKAALESHRDSPNVLTSPLKHEMSLPSSGVPVTNLANQDVSTESVRQPRSVVEETTKKLNDHGNKR
jgi:hypothetical protein